MCLIHNQDRAQATAVARFEHLAQLKEQIRLGLPILNVEQRGQVMVELGYGQARVEDIGHQHGTIEPLHYPAQHGRLVSAVFTAYYASAFATLEAVANIGYQYGLPRS